MFEIGLWNVQERVLDNLPRTNNSLEGWHRAFDQRVRVTHPTYRRLVATLRKEQATNELLIAQVLAGFDVTLIRKSYAAVNDKLKNLVSSYSGDHVQFLSSVAYNL